MADHRRDLIEVAHDLETKTRRLKKQAARQMGDDHEDLQRSRQDLDLSRQLLEKMRKSARKTRQRDNAKKPGAARSAGATKRI